MYFANKFEHELNALSTFEEPLLTQAHHGTVDAVCLMNQGKQCVTGARNYSLSFWNLKEEDQQIEKLREIKQAHSVWLVCKMIIIWIVFRVGFGR